MRQTSRSWVQGLADAFIMLRLPFTSDEAKKLNQEIFETLYFAAVTASMECKEEGPYSSFKGSPMSKESFNTICGMKMRVIRTLGLGFFTQRGNGARVRNSLLVAPMPTASTSQILGNNEAFEPYTSNIYTRRVLSGNSSW
jgi:ribonucleoside-diphosphate reductase alpha chain